MANTKKLTKRDKFNMLLGIEAVSGNDMLVEFINNELELLDKKASSKGQTTTQKENEGIKEKLMNILTNSEKALSISEIQALDTELPTSNQKISALLAQLVNTHLIVRVKDGKKTLFSAKTE